MGDPQAIVPPHLTVRVICDHDHILSGLFVIFKLKPKTGGGAWDRVARVLEGTAEPGQAPADPSQPAPGAKPKTPSATQKRKYEEAKNAWQAQYNARRDLPPDPSDRFVAGFVDDDGYLVPVHVGSNPWLDATTRRDPDAYKLGLGEEYQACLLRHPDPALARAVARHLNGEATAADAKYGIAGWGALLRDVKVENKATESGDQYVIVLSEDPSHFVPAGPARYGGWALYLDMPHAMCAGVPDQIERLHEDLARLRYPTGEEYPFKFRDNKNKKLISGFLVSRSLAARVRYAKAKAKERALTVGKADYMQEHVFRMQSQLISAIGGFQEDLLARRAFALSDKASAFDKGRSWAYVLGASFTFAEGSTDPKAWALPPYLYLGVADAFTASMLEHWEAHGLRKPGSVMVETQQTGYGLWMQERAAVAVDAWALLLRAFGVDYTKSALHGGSSFRRLVDNPWPGSIKASLHNSGFAIDLAGGGRRHSLPLWPIRFEADWVEKSERERAKLASSDAAVVDRGNLEHILMFKLYAHSSLDVFGSKGAALATLRANLEALARADGTGGLRDAFLKLFKGLDATASEAYLAAALQPAVRWARALLAKTDDELVQPFFRDKVHQFLVNAYEADAGTSMPAHGPRDGAGDFAPVSWAKSWVNVSALGYELGMERIGAHQNDVRNQYFLWGDNKDKTDKTAPVTLSMLAYMKEPDPESDLVSLIHDVTAPPSEAPENVHYARPLALRPKPGAAPVMEIQPSEIDRAFFVRWREKLGSLPAPFRPGQKASKDPSAATGAQLRVVLSAVPGKDAGVLEAASVLEGLGTQRFVVLHAGSLAVAQAPERTLLTGAQLGAAIRGALAGFQAIVKERWRLEDEAAAEPAGASAAGPSAAGASAADPSAPKPQLSRDQLRRRERAEAAKTKAREKEATKAAPDWTIVIQPVFVTGAADPSALPFLPSHYVTLPRSTSPNHLEWWHYQHRQTGKNWGEAVSECGYSHTILGSPRAGLPGAEPVIHRGAGFDGELDNKVGSINWGQPGNTFAPPSGG